MSRVTLHMTASLDGFIARNDGGVDWLETDDDYPAGVAFDPGSIEAFLATIDCYVMGSKTYEVARGFEAKGFGWPYGDKPTFVLTHRPLTKSRDSVEFCEGDLRPLVNDRLRPRFKSIWIAGGGELAADCLRLGLVDELRYTVLPVLIGDGLPFFGALDKDQPLHLVETTAYKNGMVELRYEVRKP